MTTEEKIIEVINKIKPYIQNDGGDITFKRFENGIAYISLGGACANCALIDDTISLGIEHALTSEVPEVIKVINED